MAYNALDGITTMTNVTFSNFGVGCGGTRNYAISDNPRNVDGQHPVNVQNIFLNNVDKESKIWINRPDIGSINPSDCVDMDCDGQKKCLLTDMDGSLLGSPGSVISHSEFGWGDPQRG